jgi:hypothetical protein
VRFSRLRRRIPARPSLLKPAAGPEPGLESGWTTQATDLTTFKDQLRYAGEIDISVAARLLHDAAFTPVLMWGPWRVVNVGRTMPTVPAWMRSILQMIWRRCPAPECDQPAAWSDDHHEIAWKDGGDTDLNKTAPPCRGHHTMITKGGWTLRVDRDTGICTWTSPQRRTFDVHPP